MTPETTGLGITYWTRSWHMTSLRGLPVFWLPSSMWLLQFGAGSRFSSTRTSNRDRTPVLWRDWQHNGKDQPALGKQILASIFWNVFWNWPRISYGPLSDVTSKPLNWRTGQKKIATLQWSLLSCKQQPIVQLHSHQLKGVYTRWRLPMIWELTKKVPCRRTLNNSFIALHSQVKSDWWLKARMQVMKGRRGSELFICLNKFQLNKSPRWLSVQIAVRK